MTEPEQSDKLIRNKEYNLWREGEYIGSATYRIHKCNKGFMKRVSHPEHGKIWMVYLADKWELKK